MRAKCVALANVVPGMTTAKPVKDPQGRTLCKEGTPLTERLISRFTQMQIATLYIESDEVITPEEKKRMEASLKNLFQNVLEDPLLKQLHEILENNLSQLE